MKIGEKDEGKRRPLLSKIFLKFLFQKMVGGCNRNQRLYFAFKAPEKDSR